MARLVVAVPLKVPTRKTNLATGSTTQRHRSLVQEGVAAIERGEHADYNESELKEFFAGVVERGKKRLAAELKRSKPVR